MIFSRSRSDNQLGNPSVYTRVANFLPWIQNRLVNKIMCVPENSTKYENESKEVKVVESQADYCFQTSNTSCANSDCGKYQFEVFRAYLFD